MTRLIRLTRVAAERRFPLLVNLDHVVAVTEANDSPDMSVVYVGDGSKYVVLGTVDTIEKLAAGRGTK